MTVFEEMLKACKEELIPYEKVLGELEELEETLVKKHKSTGEAYRGAHSILVNWVYGLSSGGLFYTISSNSNIIPGFFFLIALLCGIVSVICTTYGYKHEHQTFKRLIAKENNNRKLPDRINFLGREIKKSQLRVKQKQMTRLAEIFVWAGYVFLLIAVLVLLLRLYF